MVANTSQDIWYTDRNQRAERGGGGMGVTDEQKNTVINEWRKKGGERSEEVSFPRYLI